jgi:peptidyl-prolyl cis-trans isomerase B (cyclophilin B)
MVCAVLALAGCSGGNHDGATSAGDGATPVANDSTPATPASGASCSYPNSGNPAKPVNPPTTANVPNSGTVDITMTTGDGVIDMTFDRGNAPCAVNSFVSLAGQHYFDSTTCHRLAVGFVLQCGDPTGTGTGGPGYSFADELTGQEKYSRGTVAMANAGPNTNGSQFFIVLADSTLQPQYTVLGHVDDASMTVVDSIVAKDGDPNSQTPLHPIEVQSITVG